MGAYRSRLQKLEEKRNLQKAALLGLGSVMMVALVALLGIPMLVRLAVFVGDVKSSGKVGDITDQIPPSPPRLFVAYETTNVPTMSLSGVAEPGSTVYLTRDTSPAGQVVTKDDGVFDFTNITLKMGENKFEAVALDLAGNRSQPSEPVTIVYTNKEPKLDVQSPTDGQKITGKTANVEVKGLTDDGVRLTVNDRVVIVSSGGAFATRYNLIGGDNVLRIVATDRAGNQTKREITVNYAP